MRRRGGYLLFELMVVLGLVVFASSIAIQMAHWSLNHLASTRDADSRNAALDQCVSRLRQDVWTASSMQSPDAGTLLLNAGGDGIRWQCAADGIVTRSQGKERQTWKAGASGVAITIDRASVGMEFPDTPESRGGSITLISQAKLLEAGEK